MQWCYSVCLLGECCLTSCCVSDVCLLCILVAIYPIFCCLVNGYCVCPLRGCQLTVVSASLLSVCLSVCLQSVECLLPVCRTYTGHLQFISLKSAVCLLSICYLGGATHNRGRPAVGSLTECCVALQCLYIAQCDVCFWLVLL